MTQRLSAAEKGKGIAEAPTGEGRKRIRAPDFDTSELVQANFLTLIGRLTNPQEQRVLSLIASLPSKWHTKGNVVGADLGQACFQFRFDREDDLKMVLAKRPYHFNKWMVILERWEPIISNTFPAQIPFWIRLKGLPLHYWHEKMIYKISHELGHLEDYDISATSARIRILIDGLSPITKDTIIDFAIGEEALITLEYEGLQNFCAHCLHLSHPSSDCPTRSRRSREAGLTSPSVASRDRTESQRLLRPTGQVRSPHRSGAENRHISQHNGEPYSQRLDRHGKPFGERISSTLVSAKPISNRASSQDTRPEGRRETPVVQSSPPYNTN